MDVLRNLLLFPVLEGIDHMLDDITFVDLAVLLKITPNTPMEKLGAALNATIFDASNIAGTLKQKDLINFTANYPGPNYITITDTGKALIAEAESRSSLPLDQLDHSLLAQMSGGRRLLTDLQSTLGIRAKDLAIRLYKLYRQNLIIYELRNGSIELLLTEQGFLQAKGSGTQNVKGQTPQNIYQTTQPQQKPVQINVQTPQPPEMKKQVQEGPHQEAQAQGSEPRKTPLIERPPYINSQSHKEDNQNVEIQHSGHPGTNIETGKASNTEGGSKMIPYFIILIIILVAAFVLYYVNFH